MKNFKLFGQEPAALVGVVEAILALLLSFGLFKLDQDTVAAIVAAVSAGLGLLAAWATKDTLLTALVGFAKAALVLAAAYGLSLTDSQTGSLIAAITITGGFYLRSKTSSTETPISSASPGEVVQVNNLAYSLDSGGAFKRS